MSYRPEDFPGTYPDEWYETYVGKIVGHVSLLRDMLGRDSTNPYIMPSHFIPRIFFSIVSWEGGQCYETISGGSGIVMDLLEDRDVPAVTLADFKLFDEILDDPEDSIVVDRSDLKRNCTR
ncbi:MAG: hypothetical protein JWO47_654 [Candidatus Saccharibacteria bacterium]|nr:hypothetical protein [Candidatus Saccharibacteria bacterium]